VNGTTIFRHEIEAVAATRSVTFEEALKLTVQAEALAIEARHGGFPAGESPPDRFPLARRYLATVFSEETLCARITPREIRQFYEVTYQPEWPVDVYKGEVVELRCCPDTETECPAARVEACLARHRPLLKELEVLRERWPATSLPEVNRLRRNYPELAASDFGFIVWPTLPPARRKPHRLFDAATIQAVIALSDGEISPPLTSSLGYHLIKLVRTRKAITADSPPFVRLAQKELCRERIERTRRDYVERLVKAAVVERVE